MGFVQILDILYKVAAILAVGIIYFAMKQVSLLKEQVGLMEKQLKTEHERGRREKTVDLLIKWSDSLKQESSLARKIVESFSEEECRKLFKQEKFIVTKEQYNSIREIMDCNTSDSDDKQTEAFNGTYLLNEREILRLRWLVMAYINMLESVLVAWHHSIVDKDMIEEQFLYLFDQQEGYNALAKFRAACGGANAFPAIEAFSKVVEEKKTRKLNSQGILA